MSLHRTESSWEAAKRREEKPGADVWVQVRRYWRGFGAGSHRDGAGGIRQRSQP